jgi:hypothetical protein
MGEFIFIAVISSQNSIADTADVMTSKSSTLPYDSKTMQQMIRLVRNAKGELRL